VDKEKLGRQRMLEVLGSEAEGILNRFQSLSPEFTKHVLEFGYGSLYTREAFPDSILELAAVACLVGQRNSGGALKAHLGGMLNLGWSRKEITELLIFLTGFVGFPAIAEGIKMLNELEHKDLPEG